MFNAHERIFEITELWYLQTGILIRLGNIGSAASQILRKYCQKPLKHLPLSTTVLTLSFSRGVKYLMYLRSLRFPARMLSLRRSER